MAKPNPRSRPTPEEAQLAAYNRLLRKGDPIVFTERAPHPGVESRIEGEAFIKMVPMVVVAVERWGLVPVEYLKYRPINPQQ